MSADGDPTPKATATRALERENRRLRDALATVDACTPLLESADAGEIHAAALDLLLEATGRRRGFSVFRRASFPGSDGVVFRGFGEGEARALRHLLVEEKQGVAIAGVDGVRLHELPPFDPVLREAGIPAGAALAVPLGGDAAERGVAWLFLDGAPLQDAARERAELVARYAGVALAGAERYATAKERAFIDDVTDVYNARYLLEATDNEIQRAHRYGKQLSVLFLDLDRFKRVNDCHGHLVGSRVLRRLSEVLKDCVRQVDTLARYGGDEFTILLVDTGLETGLQVAERIRRLVANTIFESDQGDPIRLTISIGVATFPDHGEHREVLLDLADKAMYLAKSQGRDCVCSASELG